MVVYVALRSIEEEALYAPADSLFERLAEDARPVGGDFCAADGVGMGAEAYNRDIRSTRATEADQVDLFVRRSESFFYIRVVDAWICANGAILHPVAADERDLFAFGFGDSHL